MLTGALELPDDPHLRPLLERLRPETVLRACRDQFSRIHDGPPPEWRCCRMIEALYHPGRYVRAAFALMADDSIPPNRVWPQGEVVYLHGPLRTPVSRRGGVLDLGGENVEAYRFPNDRRLRGLRKFTGRSDAATAWQRWIDSGSDTFDLDADSLRRVLIRYVPEQKWIIRLRARGTEYANGRPSKRSIAVRCTSTWVCGELERRHRLFDRVLERGESGLSFPGVVGVHLEGGLLATEWIRGKTLIEMLAREPADRVLQRVARSLTAFHTLPIRTRDTMSLPDIDRRIRDAAFDMGHALPERRREVERIGRTLRRVLSGLDAPADATLHNDFHWNQLRLDGDRIVFLDLERVCVGDPLIDVANLATQLRMLADRPAVGVRREDAARWAEAFLEAWSRETDRRIDPRRFRCYAALSRLELARGMMRHLRSGWRDLAERCITLAERDVSSTSGEVVVA